jgi:hypothetical protein
MFLLPSVGEVLAQPLAKRAMTAMNEKRANMGMLSRTERIGVGLKAF